MTIDEALTIVIERTGVERYRWLCSNENPHPSPNDPATWQAWIIEQAGGPPPVIQQAKTFFTAMREWVASGMPVAHRLERQRRQGICEECPKFNAEAKRCMSCGCSTSLKPWLLTARCPLGKWESTS